MSSTLIKGIKNSLYIILSIILMMMMSREGRSQSFIELESQLINNAHTNSWNVAWVDVNGDGFDDLFLPEYDVNTTSHVYLNDGIGGFYESLESEDLVEKVAGSISSTWADIDNDGDRDVHISNFTGGPNFLIVNNNDGTFTDATIDMNPNSVGYFHGSSWADYNNDGHIDLFTSSFLPTKFSELYFNNGDGTFTQELESPVAYHTGRSIGSTWVDYDNDGWQDLFIPNGNGQDNSLFHNLGNGQFEPVVMGDIVNDGSNSVASCWVELKVPDGVYLISANHPWDMVVGNTYLWQFDTLNPGEAGSVIIVDSVGLELSVGDSVLFHTSITTYLDELDTWNDAVSNVEPIVGAIDPNDIQVSPRGFGDKGIIDRADTLVYRIRFQNVGSYAAQNIYIKDELPDELDVSTVEIINMSHPGNYWVEGNTINWKFLNINLPDSTANEQASHGFVTFSIIPRMDVAPGQEIKNEASIEFDFEAPLETNSTLNTIKEMSRAEDNVLEIFPNPMNETAVFRLKRNREIFEDRVAITEYAIYDFMGKQVRARSSLSQFSERIDRTGLQAGTYIIIARDANDETHQGKLVVSNTNIE